ncbi:hypothetical protein EMMF5_001261 [Cystobasidiomycetes sp. EMM_F5]
MHTTLTSTHTSTSGIEVAPFPSFSINQDKLFQSLGEALAKEGRQFVRIHSQEVGLDITFIREVPKISAPVPFTPEKRTKTQIPTSYERTSSREVSSPEEELPESPVTPDGRFVFPQRAVGHITPSSSRLSSPFQLAYYQQPAPVASTSAAVYLPPIVRAPVNNGVRQKLILAKRAAEARAACARVTPKQNTPPKTRTVKPRTTKNSNK